MLKLISILSWVLLLITVCTKFASAQASDSRSTAITVYNNDLGVVRDVRRFEIKQGASEVRMQDVPSRIDPTTVKISDVEHPKDLEVLEQNYEYDLVSQQKLLEKYIDKTITVEDGGKSITGKLLAAERDKVTLETANGIEILPSSRVLTVPNLPGGLVTKPTLVWLVNSKRTSANEPLEVSYQTGGLTWHAEYIATLADDDKSLDLSAWVSIDNTSGATYENAKLKLVAGALHRVQPQPHPMYGEMALSRMSVSAPQFEEHGMFEYHVYDLGRQTTIANDEVKQISLLSADRVGTEKHYTYEGGKDVIVTLTFPNSEANHLGMPLPTGTIRVMKRDKDGSLQFVGEDHIDHTPRDEKISLHVGNAFDLTGERTQLSQENLGPNAREETDEITLRNHKDNDVTIDAIENLGSSWEITQSSIPYEKKDANHIVFHVPVKARGEEKLTYSVRYRW